MHKNDPKIGAVYCENIINKKGKNSLYQNLWQNNDFCSSVINKVKKIQFI